MEHTHSNTTFSVTAISLYPLKGAGAVGVDRAEVTSRGLRGDRCWMVVDSDGRFLSQRSHPALAVVGSALLPDGLVLAAPDRAPVTCRVPDPSDRCQVEIWRDTVEAAAGPAEASAWLSDLLGLPCRLVYQDRPDSRSITSSRGRPGETVSFADGFPVLLCSESSLADLNGRLSQPVSMDRFRPNLVVTGSDPFAEDRWRRLVIGSVTFRNAGPCPRCSVTTVDQTTGQKETEPLRTLATYRQETGGVMFGVNLVPEITGMVAEGDPVRILE